MSIARRAPSFPYNGFYMPASREPTDLRRQRALFNRALFRWVLFVLVVVGAALVAFSYGSLEIGLVALVCLLAGAGVIALLWGVFTLIGRWAGE